MVTTAFWVLGYWRTERLASERAPSTRMSRLSVVARTGLRMKMSVKFIAGLSLFLRGRIGIVQWLNRIVDDQRCAVLELDAPARHDFGSRLDAGEDRHLVAAGRSGGDEYLLRDQRRFRLFVLLLVFALGSLYDENGVAIGVVGYCRLRQGQVTLFPAGFEFHGREHAGKQQALGVGHRRFNLDVARAGIDLGVDRIDFADERRAGIGIGRDRDLLSHGDLRQLLLRKVEVHIDRVDGLQGHQLVARVQVLARINRADTELAGERSAYGFLVERRYLLRD